MLLAPPRSDTRDALLTAARKLFAKKGYDGASIRAITTEAGANLGAVTYHFGSKRRLYEAVLDQVLQPMDQRADAVFAAPGTPLDRLEALVRAFFAQLDEHPDQPFLILQEIAAGKPAPQRVRHSMARIVPRLAEVVAQGQADGSIRSGDPVMMVLSVLAQPVYMSLARRAFREKGGPRWEDPDVRDNLVEHSVAFVRAGLVQVRQEGQASSEGTINS